ncbi:MAG: hypothetical protein GPJ00_02930 [Microcystis aeruginosa W13-18]|nr:hypothetical protein [Microcystis aeruginosa W13-18]
MKSLTTPDFWQCYANLPPYIKQQAKKAYRLWISNVFHRSLHFKKVGKNVWFFVTWYGSIGGHKSTKSLSGKRFN